MKRTNKFKDGFVRGVKKRETREQEQRRLKKKHDIQKEDVVVVEKANMAKFLLKLMIGFVKFAAMAILFVLATVGMITFIYPEVRDDFLKVLFNILGQVQTMTGIHIWP